MSVYLLLYASSSPIYVRADNPWLSRDCRSNSGCQGYSDRGVEEYRWLTIPGCPGIVRVTLVVRDTLTGGLKSTDD